MTARHALTVLAVANPHRAAALYEAAFGWTRTLSVPPYVELALPGGQRLGFHEHYGFTQHTGADPVRVPPGAVGPAELYLYVDDLAAACAALEAAGARPTSPASFRGWGDTVAYFADLDGHVIAVAVPA